MTSQEFIESAPLYTKYEVEDYEPPASITRMCPSDRCKKETTWERSDVTSFRIQTAQPEISFKTVAYTCVLCRQNSFAVIYKLLNWSENQKSAYTPKRWHHTGVRKIGQVPPQEITIPSELNDRLGTTAAHYRKALICREQNYGIAAMAYLRRVVDEKTDELIDVMAELSRTYNVDEKEIATLLDVKKVVRYEDKLKVAAELIPQAVKPGGVNPLGQLYKHTSLGLHSKSDDECIGIFDDLKADFEYVFRNLHLQADERREYVERMTKRAGKNLPSL
jgi:hypothetical protein